MSMASLLDRRFKASPFMSPGQKMVVFTQIANKAAELYTEQVPRIQANTDAVRDPAPAPVQPQLPSPSESEAPNPSPVRTEARSDQETDTKPSGLAAFFGQ